MTNKPHKVGPYHMDLDLSVSSVYVKNREIMLTNYTGKFQEPRLQQDECTSFATRCNHICIAIQHSLLQQREQGL